MRVCVPIRKKHARTYFLPYLKTNCIFNFKTKKPRKVCVCVFFTNRHTNTHTQSL